MRRLLPKLSELESYAATRVRQSGAMGTAPPVISWWRSTITKPAASLTRSFTRMPWRAIWHGGRD